MSKKSEILTAMADKFERRTAISAEAREGLLSLPFDMKTVPPHRYLVREGDMPAGPTLLVKGLAYRHRVTVEGARQILSVHIPGDMVDLENTLLTVADHSIQALTDCEVAVFSKADLLDLIERHGELARAMWIDTLIDGSIFREWIVNVGRRSARAGMAHLLCEFARRLESAGLGSENGYELPMTQEQLADSLGLTPVHVNRTLKELNAAGLIERTRRHVRIPDWEKLRKEGGFNELYLHLHQVPPIGDRMVSA